MCKWDPRVEGWRVGNEVIKGNNWWFCHDSECDLKVWWPILPQRYSGAGMNFLISIFFLMTIDKTKLMD